MAQRGSGSTPKGRENVGIRLIRLDGATAQSGAERRASDGAAKRGRHRRGEVGGRRLEEGGDGDGRLLPPLTSSTAAALRPPLHAGAVLFWPPRRLHAFPRHFASSRRRVVLAGSRRFLVLLEWISSPVEP
jgi:hypothetical protein